MAAVDFACLLGAIEITTANQRLILDEGGVSFNADVTPGIYYLKGDNASNDICQAIKDALDAAGANTYSVKTAISSVETWSRSDSAVTCSVQVSRAAGAATFRVRWPNASTTFPIAAVGFAVEKGAADANAETSTLSPTHAWVGTGHIEDAPPSVSWEVSQRMLENGDTDVIRTSDARSPRRVVLPMQSATRLYSESATVASSDLESFLDVVLDGRPVQFHRLTLQSGSTVLLNGPTTSTLKGTYRCGEAMARVLESPTRAQTGIDQFDLEMQLESYVA